MENRPSNARMVALRGLLLVVVALSPLTAGATANGEESSTSCGFGDTQTIVQNAVSAIQRKNDGATRNDLRKAIEDLECVAARGNISAQVILGHVYQTGKVVEKNVEKSVSWLISASGSGNYEAMMPLFALYVGGLTKYRVDDFFKVVQEHAVRNNLGAMFILGTSYCFGYYNGYDEGKCNTIIERVKEMRAKNRVEERKLQDSIRHAGLYDALVIRLEKTQEY